ncbi:MAG: hypothetical protein L6420_12240 [Elusimicrobia bacterium]|nr:hypothetical protein [Elusimicrobiota bacterium]
MDKIKSIIMPVSILMGFIVLGAFLYISQVNKQKSMEKQQAIELQENRRIEELKLAQLKQERLTEEIKEQKEKEELEKEFEQTRKEIEGEKQQLARQLRREKNKKQLIRTRKAKRWETQVMKDIEQALQNYEQIIKDSAQISKESNELAVKNSFTKYFSNYDYAQMAKYFSGITSTNTKLKSFWQIMKKDSKEEFVKGVNEITEKKLQDMKTVLEGFVGTHKSQIEQLEKLRDLKEPVNYLNVQMIKHERELIESIKEFSKDLTLAVKDLQEQG